MKKPNRRKTPKPRTPAKSGKRPETAQSPLLMMPMRLEYRVVTQKEKVNVLRRAKNADTLLKLRLKLSQTRPDDETTIAGINREIEDLTREAEASGLSLEPLELKNRTEIWMRWYPDDSFAESGLAPASERETEALEAFLDHPQSRSWPRLAEGEMTALWAELVAVAGEARAVHLMRTYGATEDPLWESRIGRITGLPGQVSVFALHKGDLTEIGRGNPVPPNTDWGGGLVSYAPAVVGDGSWMSDFHTALQLGMGLKLRDPTTVELALAADWLICVGISGENGREELEKLLADKIADGGFEFLHQDTPTNNTPDAPAGAQKSDSVQGRLGQRASFELGSLQDTGLGWEVLATALGVDGKTLAKATGAGESGHLDAAAMIRLIGPALMDGSLAATPVMNGVTDTGFIELLAQHVQAGGCLPGVKFGTSAYGILPVADVLATPAKPYKLSSTEANYERFIRLYTKIVGRMMVAESETTTTRLEPDDPDASEKLTDILQTSSVSRRIDVANEGEDMVSGLECPYVNGTTELTTPRKYLMHLLTMPVRDLVKPDETDTEWPLLYRLAHLSLTRNRELGVLAGSSGFGGRGNLRRIQGNWMNGLSAPQRNAVNQSRQYSVEGFNQAKAAALNLIPARRRGELKVVNARFSDALKRLHNLAAKPGGIERLETLMMEVVDLFQHRLDAWITGLASIRLARLRESHPETGLVLGCFGMLGKLREKSVTVAGDGYIQAPSQGQAVTAAILRSAFLRHRSEGAFEIDLSAGRTRRALKIMEHIRHGIPLPECLGMRGERWLRDRQLSMLIFEMRTAYPLENPDADGQGARGPAGRRCFDGLGFLQAAPAGLTPEQRKLQKTLHDDMDALADLVVAEAVHHRAAGAANVASAWLRVLSGGPVPHLPEFIRSYRSGHASDYRVSLVLPQGPAAENGSPLRLAEYGLAALLDKMIPALNDAAVMARIMLGNETVYEVKIHLATDLGLDAIHLARLGVEPLRRRMEAFAISDLHAKLTVQEMQDRGWALDREGAAAAGLHVILELGMLEEDLKRGAALWGMAHAGQALSAGDLSNAADPDAPLDEASHIAAIQGAAADLWARLERIFAAMRATHKSYGNRINSIFRMIAEDYETPGISWGADMRRDQALQKDVVKLHAMLLKLQNLDLEGAGTLPAASRLVVDMAGSEAELRRPLAALEARLLRVRESLSLRNAAPASLSEARADLRAATAALQLSTGIESLAIFPVFEKTEALTPLLLAPQSAKDALGPWPDYRARLARLLERAGSHLAGYAVHPDATADDKEGDGTDMRDERDAPRAYHRGIFLAGDNDMTAASISGIVVDEWVEKRPASQQDAAIALNYDAPQAEAPNTLILAVPEAPGSPPWSHERAALIVRQMLDLMKMRALTTQTTPLENTILPLANLVAHLGNGPNERPRLPTSKYPAGLKSWFATGGQRDIVADAELNILGRAWNQTGQYRPGGKDTP